jgi:hypothetical protein
MKQAKRVRNLVARRLLIEGLDSRRLFSIDLVRQVCLPADSVKIDSIPAVASTAKLPAARLGMSKIDAAEPGPSKGTVSEHLDQEVNPHDDAHLDDEHHDDVHHDHDHDSLLRVTEDGLRYYIDPIPDDLLASPVQGMDPGNGGGISLGPETLDTPVYHSLPSAPQKIFLDFDGHVVTGTPWNNRQFNTSFTTGSQLGAAPFSLDSDLNSFSSSELSRIREIWARVAEDFAPFNVDVTTEDPGTAAFTAGGQAVRVLISTDIDTISNQRWFSNAGGVAYLDSWKWTSDTPVWVFTNRLQNNEKYIAEAASHEVGHALDLEHDGTSSVDYYTGHGSGNEGWAPIMGVAYYQSLGQWSRGQYAGANNLEDDLAIIAARIPYRQDDHGDDLVSATYLTSDSNGDLSAAGVITTANDKDAFAFVTQTGSVSLNFDGFENADGKGNLDLGLQLFDASGSLVSSASPLNQLGAQISATLTKGLYTVVASGVGRAAVTGHAGYTDYGSLGQYFFTGTIVPNAAPQASADTFFMGASQTKLLDVLDNDSDSDQDQLTITAVTQPVGGVATIVGDAIQFDAEPGFIGETSFEYTVWDGLDGFDSASVTIQVVAPAIVSDVQINDGDPSRSRVESLRIEFSSEVDLSPEAFELFRRDAENSLVPTALQSSLIAGRTVAILQFAGPLTESGSLADGNYELVVSAAGIADIYGNPLDGDGDLVPGDDYQFGADEADNFFRFFGDANGDRSVDGSDFSQFRTSYGRRAGASGFDAQFDFDGNLAVGLSDYRAFQIRYGRQLDFQ